MTRCGLVAVAGLLAMGLTSSAHAAEPSFVGRVVDSQTHAGIPYANIGVPAMGLGTVSDADGVFKLRAIDEDGVIVISAIGYQLISVPRKLFPQTGEIGLSPVEIGFVETVSVTAKPLGAPETFGNRYPERGYGFGFGSALLGAEIGARIRIKRPTYLETAHFTVAHTGGERFLYRVNIYDFSGKKIGANLLKQNVIIAAKQERGTLTVDLRDQNLIVRDDVLLALEWIEDDAEIGNANVMFRAKPRSRTTLYQKLTSQMPFRPIQRHGVGFFLVGYTLD